MPDLCTPRKALVEAISRQMALVDDPKAKMQVAKAVVSGFVLGLICSPALEKVRQAMSGDEEVTRAVCDSLLDDSLAAIKEGATF